MDRLLSTDTGTKRCFAAATLDRVKSNLLPEVCVPSCSDQIHPNSLAHPNDVLRHDVVSQVAQWIEEEKRQHKLVSLLRGQREIKNTEAMRAQHAEKETAQQVLLYILLHLI